MDNAKKIMLEVGEIRGLHNEAFLVIHGCVFSCISLNFKYAGQMPLFHIYVRFLPCCCKKVIKGACANGGILKIAFVLFDIPGTSCFNRFQASFGFARAFLSAS